MNRAFGKLGNNCFSTVFRNINHSFGSGCKQNSISSMHRKFNIWRCTIGPHSMHELCISYRYQHSLANEAKGAVEVKNDFATNHELQEKTSDKLRDILNDIGMSVSQWKIRDSKTAFDQKLKLNSVTKRRRKRRGSSSGNKDATQMLSNSDTRPLGESLFTYPRRMSEEFDIYNGQYSGRRKSNYVIMGDHADIVARLRVKSIHVASQINIAKVLTTVFGPDSAIPAMRHMFGKTSIIIELPPVLELCENKESNKNSASTPFSRVKKNVPPTSKNGEVFANDYFHSEQSQPRPRFVAVFRYGSVVLFNVSPKDAGSILEDIKSHSTEPIPKPFERRERFEVAISPNMQETAHVNADFATVKELNINNVAIISRIMAQTVAFDSYNDMVDELLATFADINSTVKRTGNFTAMEKDMLFKVVAQNNSLFIDIIAKLGIKERSDTAWNMSQYERLYDGMRDEFEIENRFDQIELKLNMIQQNAKFFLELLHNQKSDTLEWIIIVLIGFECILMIMDMSGLGEAYFPKFGSG